MPNVVNLRLKALLSLVWGITPGVFQPHLSALNQRLTTEGELKGESHLLSGFQPDEMAAPLFPGRYPGLSRENNCFSHPFGAAPCARRKRKKTCSNLSHAVGFPAVALRQPVPLRGKPPAALRRPFPLSGNPSCSPDRPFPRSGRPSRSSAAEFPSIISPLIKKCAVKKSKFDCCQFVS
jgi:hypothetical protein